MNLLRASYAPKIWGGCKIKSFAAHKNAPDNTGEALWQAPDLDIKIIDARETLSIQVHPQANPDRKDESWFILDAEPGSFVYLGLNSNHSKQTIENAIKNNSLTQLLNVVHVKTGDIFHVSPGTIHAIGSGILLLEAQEKSDTTFRLYDFNRGRELHVEDGLLCLTNVELAPRHILKKQPPSAAMAFFTDESASCCLFVKHGRIMIEHTIAECGDLIYLPAETKLICYRSLTIDTEVITITTGVK